MAVAVLLLVLAQPAPSLEDLAHESRAVRDEAIRRLAAGGPPSAAVAARLADPDERVASGAAEVLRLRRDPDVLAQLARAADVPDATRGAAAAAALVATAGEARVDVAALSFPGMCVLPTRLDDAYGSAVAAALLPLGHRPSVDRPQAYRALHAGGDHAARALRDFARDRRAPAAARAHALHALARLTGEASVEELADAEPLVREAAASLVLRYGDEKGLARLAARLDEAGALRPSELHCAVLAARRTRRVGPAGILALERAVRDGEARLAADAAAALLAADPAAGGRALRARVLRHLTDAENRAATGKEAALFELRAGPLPEDLRERMRRAEDPLVAACVAEDPFARLRPLVGQGFGDRDAFRIEIVARVLDRPGAPEADRMAFAACALASDVGAAHRAGLEALRGIPPEAWAALKPVVVRSLADQEEPIRLAAAALVLPAPDALLVCADALYDGDPSSARRVASILAAANVPGMDPRAPVAERRRASAELRRQALRGKE
jgi:hypothetical protein